MRASIWRLLLPAAAAEHVFDVTPETLEKSDKALEEAGVTITKDVDKEAFKSMISDMSGIGGMLIPAMKGSEYPADFSAAVTAASSTIGTIIPPLATFLPGLLG